MSSEARPLLDSSYSADECSRSWTSRLRTSRIEGSRLWLQRFLTSKAGHYSILLLVSLDVSCIFADFVINLFTCEARSPKSGYNTALEVLGIVSLVFSCLFMVELLASVWAFGNEYFKSKFHCFDALVIVAGFTVDILLRGVIEEVASLVVILRLWRVVKIIEELSVGAQEQTEGLLERIADLEEENRDLKAELQHLKANLPTNDAEDVQSVRYY
ncbi:hypothetical protein K432DRAFT_442360 [Lepidopterella palustris CBS 459.81]|uniref:Voltage-gated hydrogen channel 1 n=1 Tax=Lepidopterella palustris CBS 459.81 TaxID=1314670 RepID=A0A8E2ECH8_9PEZI|nr:hypothetical protein K432DRAFT_442360 [Lepidopterella palustris CBS 459.81]